MSWFAVIERALSPVLSVIDKSVADKDQAERLKAKLRMALLSQESQFAGYARDVVVAEIEGKSWLQRNWRPGLMWLFGAIIANNHLVYPYVATFFPESAVYLPIPQDMWLLIQLSVGGYIGARTVEKVTPKIGPIIGRDGTKEQNQ